ncbi:MAG: DUF3553 domain-containing protein [Pseudomonadota bacterium]
MTSDALVPGAWVRHPERPEWGLGQVQSIVGHRVTVNFEHAGKLLINAAVVALEPAAPDPIESETASRPR